MSTPRGIVALAAFFAFGAVMSGLSAVLLLMPGGILDDVWTFNPDAHRNLQAMGAWGPVLMFAVCTTCAATAIGLFRRAAWGHSLALALIVVNLVADIAGAAVRKDLRTLIGVPIAGVMIAYLLRPGVRQWFRP